MAGDFTRSGYQRKTESSINVKGGSQKMRKNRVKTA